MGHIYQLSSDLIICDNIICTVIVHCCSSLVNVRLLTSVYEAVTIHRQLKCEEEEKEYLPLWFLYCIAAMNSLLVSGSHQNDNQIISPHPRLSTLHLTFSSISLLAFLFDPSFKKYSDYPSAAAQEIVRNIRQTPLLDLKGFKGGITSSGKCM